MSDESGGNSGDQLSGLISGIKSESTDSLAKIIRAEYEKIILERTASGKVLTPPEERAVVIEAMQTVLTRKENTIAVVDDIMALLMLQGQGYHTIPTSITESPENETLEQASERVRKDLDTVLKEEKPEIILVREGVNFTLPEINNISPEIIKYDHRGFLVDDVSAGITKTLDSTLAKRVAMKRDRQARSEDMGPDLLLFDQVERRRAGVAEILAARGFNVIPAGTRNEKLEEYCRGTLALDFNPHRDAEIAKVVEALGTYEPHEVNEIIKSIMLKRFVRNIGEIPTFVRHMTLQGEDQHEQFIMRQLCIADGDARQAAGMLIRFIKIDGSEYTENDILEIASRNQLQVSLDQHGADVYGSLRKKADDALRRYIRYHMMPEDYITDEALLELMVQRAIGASGEAEGVNIFSQDLLEKIRQNIDGQMGIDGSSRDRVYAMITEYLLQDPDERDTESEADFYFGRISLQSLVSEIGPDAENVRKAVGERVKAVMESYPGEFGSGFITTTFRIPSPSQNQVYRMATSIVGGVSIHSAVKIYDKRTNTRGHELTEAERAEKDEEFRHEMMVANHFSRCGLNHGIHFFYERLPDVNVAMMRHWGRKNLTETAQEIERRQARETDPKYIGAYNSRRNLLMTKLVKRIAKVQAHIPLNLATEEKDMMQRFVGESLGLYTADSVPPEHKRKDLMYLFEGMAPVPLKKKYEAAAALVRDNIDALIDFMENAPGLKIATGFKDVSMNNWFVFRGNVEGTDWAALRKLPPQYDFGTVLVLGNIQPGEEQKKLAKRLFDHLNMELGSYNEWVDNQLENYKATLTNQLGAVELCQKAARPYLQELSKYVVGRTKHDDARTSAGRINRNALNEFDRITAGFFEELDEKSVGSQAVYQLREYVAGVKSYLTSLEHKKRYHEGQTHQKERDAKFEQFWEGQLAVLPYRTFMLAKSFTGFYFDQASSDRHSYIKMMGQMIGNGAAMAIGTLNREYSRKMHEKTNPSFYNESRLKKLRNLEQGFSQITECFGDLERHLAS